MHIKKYDYKTLKTVSKNVKKYRKILKLSQSKLSIGICNQSAISKLENETELPNGIILHKICRKLKIDMDILLDMTPVIKLDDEISKFLFESEDLKSKFQTNKLYSLLDSNRSYFKDGNIDFKIKFLLNEAFCYMYPNNICTSTNMQFKEIYEKTNEALTLVEVDENKHMIHNITSACYISLYNVKLFDANYALELLLHHEKEVIKLDLNYHSKIATTYYKQIATIYCWLIEDYDKAEEYTNKVINICMSTESMSNLSVSYYILASCELLRKNKTSHMMFHHLDQAIEIAKMSNNLIFLSYLLNVYNQLIERLV